MGTWFEVLELTFPSLILSLSYHPVEFRFIVYFVLIKDSHP